MIVRDKKLKQLLKALTQFDVLSDAAANIFDLLFCMKSKLTIYFFSTHNWSYCEWVISACYSKEKIVCLCNPSSSNHLSYRVNSL